MNTQEVPDWMIDASNLSQALSIAAAERERCAAWVDKRREEFMHTFGHQDPETGAWEYGTGPHATAKQEYECELAEIAEGLRAMTPSPTPAPMGQAPAPATAPGEG